MSDRKLSDMLRVVAQETVGQRVASVLRSSLFNWADRAAALEQRLADLQGVSGANEGFAGELGRERRRADEMQGQRDQAIDHVRRLNKRLAEAEVNVARWDALESSEATVGPLRVRPNYWQCECIFEGSGEPPTGETFSAIADALGCTVDELPERVAGPEGSAT